MVNVCSSIGLSCLLIIIYLGLDSTWQVKEGRKEGRQGRSGGWEEGRKEVGKQSRKEKWKNREEGKKL